MVRIYPLSHSRAKTFEECPARFKAQYVDGLPEARESYLTLGLLIHRICDRYVKHLVDRGSSSDFDQLEVIFAEEWAGLVQQGTDGVQESEARELVDRVREILVFEDIGEVQAAEMKIAVDRDWKPVEWNDPNAYFRGIIDRLDASPEGPIVIDYKSGRRIEQIGNSKQLPLYAALYAGGAIHDGFDSVGIELIYLRHGIRKTARLQAADLDSARKWIEGIGRAIERAAEANRWPAKPGLACRGCPAFRVCPARQEAIKIGPPGDEQEAHLMAERLVLLERERAEIIEALKPWVDQFGLIDVGGAILGYHLERRFKFNVVAVATILSDRGLRPLDFMNVNTVAIKKLARRDKDLQGQLDKAGVDASSTKFKIATAEDDDE